MVVVILGAMAMGNFGLDISNSMSLIMADRVHAQHLRVENIKNLRVININQLEVMFKIQ
jgi:hypothetical protein